MTPTRPPDGAPAEVTALHTRLLKSALDVDEARAYWSRVSAPHAAHATRAFDEYWFGARSVPALAVVLSNLRRRYDVWPGALATLHRWPAMTPDARRVICHVHLQLADPLYRAFTGTYLPGRRAGPRPELTRALVVSWVTDQGPGRWTLSTRIQFASKLLSAAFSAGLVTTRRDPRPLALPRVDDLALEYVLYLLRGVSFQGTLTDNPYLGSLGLAGPVLEDRVRALPGLAFQRQGSLVDFGWRFDDLAAWGRARFPDPDPRQDAA